MTDPLSDRKMVVAAAATAAFLLLLIVLASPIAAHEEKLEKGEGVTYDARSLIIHGKRELLFSGSIHYPRTTPDMWPKLLEDAKRGGLNVIQTYVFWNIHEPEEGKVSFNPIGSFFFNQLSEIHNYECSWHLVLPFQFNFEGRFDLVKYIKLIGEHGLYATVRFGPFIQAEWNHG
ncbi:unnamed protein product [Linum tenue]|uniref:beta-galactosidase n=1 Tax=Linum tenue TaxID=586396 RepID=A0AAV0MGP0_9ROSI|nr:unnamed protein product [Linum tenue]